MPVSVTLDVQDRGPLRVHCATHFEKFGVNAFVTDRSGGVSDGPYKSLNLAYHVGDVPANVTENRRRVAKSLSVTLDDLVFVDQVHEDRVVWARRLDAPERADALFTSSTDLALAIMVADCVPVLLVDEDSSDFAVLHAGWRGLAGAIVANTVRSFDDPARVHALVGPSISATRYQVGPEVADHFRDVRGALRDDHDDRSLLDLRLVAARQLVDLGLSEANVAVSAETTDDVATFFSDRATRPCGRFALVAQRLPS